MLLESISANIKYKYETSIIHVQCNLDSKLLPICLNRIEHCFHLDTYNVSLIWTSTGPNIYCIVLHEVKSCKPYSRNNVFYLRIALEMMKATVFPDVCFFLYIRLLIMVKGCQGRILTLLVSAIHQQIKCHTLADLEHNLQHLGYCGEALASIINCTGTVEICSRHCISQQTYSKLFLHGRPMSLTSSSNPRPSVGTTLTMHDFFL